MIPADNPLAPPRVLRGVTGAVLTFLALGTVTAVWPNPVFIRMTPTQGFEVWLLAIQAVLVGGYVAIRRPMCSLRGAGLGSVVAFLRIACPTCNKLLLLVFGADLLLAYFEPYRLHLAMVGAAVTGAAVAWEWRERRQAVVCPVGMSDQDLGERIRPS